jgi:hypothetical protein
MPTERLSMRHIREVLRLHHSVGMSQRSAALPGALAWLKERSAST